MAVSNGTIGSEERTVDVTIIGAGPTGLTTAVLVRRLGLSVCIIDQAEGPLEVGRADALNARTQQLLANIGVLPKLQALGVTCNTSSTFKNGEFTSRQSAWWTSLENTQFREFLMISQPEVERALTGSLDIPVLYNTAVQSVEDGRSHATVRCKDLTVKSKYVVGSDGAHSFTRKHLDIQFNGEKPNMRWAVLDTFLETDFPVVSEIISLELNEQSRVAWIPRERGLARFYVLLDGEVTQARVEASIREHMAPYSVKFKSTEWFSQFDVQERVAETFISKKNQRVLLAGDSAHVHSVNGGQGLNTGISDGFALAWRLNLACRTSNPVFLESYDKERRITAQTVVDVAAKLVRSTLRTAEEYVKIVEKSAANITGMGITYEATNPLVVEGSCGAFDAGARCPDFTLTRADGTETFFYNLFSYGQYVALVPDGIQFEIPLKASPHVAQWKVSASGSVRSSYHVVLDDGMVLTTKFDLGISQPGHHAIVVRPDLYVGYAGVEVAQYFQAVF